MKRYMLLVCLVVGFGIDVTAHTINYSVGAFSLEAGGITFFNAPVKTSSFSINDNQTITVGAFQTYSFTDISNFGNQNFNDSVDRTITIAGVGLSPFQSFSGSLQPGSMTFTQSSTFNWNLNLSGDRKTLIMRWLATSGSGSHNGNLPTSATLNEVLDNPVAVIGALTPAMELDASGSYDIDSSGSLTTWEWDLDYDGSFNAVLSGENLVVAPALLASTYVDGQEYTLALRVTDNSSATHLATSTFTYPPDSEVSFGSGGNQFSMSFVDIGHAGNAADANTGYGAVDYEYRIGKYEVTIDQFTKADNADGRIGDGDENYWNDGTRTVGVNAPASNATWYETAKFCNWLTSGDAYNGAYQFDGSGTLTNVNRGTAVTTYGKVYVLPSEDEWYKAAYLKSAGEAYLVYANGTSNAPASGTSEANYDNFTSSPNYTWVVGTGLLEQNGTFDMNGNVWEWNESAYDGALDSMAESRVVRGGVFYVNEVALHSSNRNFNNPPDETHVIGFRVAEITDPNLKKFGSGANEFEMQFVDIGYPGNAADTTGYGAVGYNYKIGKYEVTIDQITKSGAGDGDEDYWNDGTRTVGIDGPASQVSWYESAMFCNWLTSGNTNSGAYQFDASGTLTNVNRKAAVALYGDVYVLPSEDEWYKVAYYKPVNDGFYSLYANGSDSAASLTHGTSNGWNYQKDGIYVNGSPNFMWESGFGAEEQNGTYDVIGNVWEWIESAYDGTLDDVSEDRIFRSGSAYNDETTLSASYRWTPASPEEGYYTIGFRVALISNSDEEPGAYVKWTVESAYGNPDPMVGTNLVEYGTWVTNSIEAFIDVGSTQYVNLGSTEGGVTNWFTRLATNNATVAWEWATNYWVSAGISGNGSLNVSDDWYAKGSNVAVLATPDPDWLFMGWSGDLSGDYTTSNQILLVDAPKAIFASFSDDADGDGLSNSNETAIGTNPRNPDTDGDGFGDYFEVTNNGYPTNSQAAYVDYIRNNGGTFDLYSSNVVLDVAVGGSVFEVVGGTANLTLQLMKSDDLTIWTNAAPPVNWSLPVDAEKQFFRVHAEP